MENKTALSIFSQKPLYQSALLLAWFLFPATVQASKLKSPQNKSMRDFGFAVNMQDGGLILKEESDSSLNVQRTYRSRSLDTGFFGTGWCSNLESQLIFKGQGLIQLKSCAQSRPIQFKISQTAAFYINEENSDDVLFIRMGYYERKISNQETARYNLRGEIQQLRLDQGRLTIGRNLRNLPERLTISDKTGVILIRLQWHPILDLISEIQTKNKDYRYEYSGFKLTKMTEKNQLNELENWVRYTYDDLDNLTTREASAHQVAPFFVEYDSEGDQVLKVFSTCEEIYQYQKQQKRQISTVQKICSQQSTVTRFEFIFADSSTKTASKNRSVSSALTVYSSQDPTEVIVSQRKFNRSEKVSLKLEAPL